MIASHPVASSSIPGLMTWITMGLAAGLMAIASSDRILIYYLPRIDVVLALLLVLVSFSTSTRLGLGAISFLVLSLIAGYRVDDMEWAMGRSAKLLLIWIAASQWQHRPHVTRAMFWTAAAMVFINAGLIFEMSRGATWAVGEISGSGRMSTFLTMPGVLSRVGLVPLCYFLYRTVVAKLPRVVDIAGIVSCLMLVWRDGSRTGMLCVVLSWIFVMGCLFWEGHKARVTTMALATMVLGVILPTLLYQFLDSDNPLNRIAKFLDESSYNGIGAGDSSRAELNTTALSLIWEEPLLGHGLGTAVIPSYTHPDGVDVVHNVYLQQFVECGLPGLAAIACVIWCWVPTVLKRLPAMRRIPSAHERAYFYNAAFCLLSFGLMKLTHPISSEWTDWAGFCFSVAIVHQRMPPQRIPATRPSFQHSRAA